MIPTPPASRTAGRFSRTSMVKAPAGGRLDAVGDPDALVQVARDRAVALDADPVETVRGRDRERVGEDHRFVRNVTRHADGKMLTGRVLDQPGPVVRSQVNRADRAALVDDPGHAERAPSRGEVRDPKPVGGLPPVAGHQGVGRPAVRPEGPAQRQRAHPPARLGVAGRSRALRALEGRDLGRVQDDLGIARHPQEIARLEIAEDQPRLAVQQDVAENRQEQLPGEIRDGQRAVVGDAE